MTATKDDVTKYTKAELIKALRAAWVREAKFAKKVEKLLDKKDNAAAVELMRAAKPADDGPVFPWEQK